MSSPYDAFISYSHAADGALAPALQAGLHRLGRRFFQLRALRVFRDQTSLSASPELWTAIEAALARSKHFVLLASPAAAASRWVQCEIAWWLEHRSPATLFIVATEGDLVWDEPAGDFDWSATSCLPQTALGGRFAGEPLWVDLRWARSGERLTLRHARFRQAVLDIAAPIHGIDKDSLDGDDVRRAARVRQATAATALVLVAVTVAAVLSFLEARKQRDEAERRGTIADARRLAADADLARVAGADPDLAILLAAEAVQRAGGAWRTRTRRRYVALRRALAASPLVLAKHDGPQPMQLQPDGGWVAQPSYSAAEPGSPAVQQALTAGDCRPQVGVVVAATARGDVCITETDAYASVHALHVHRAEAGRPAQLTTTLPLRGSVPADALNLSADGEWLALAEGTRYNRFQLTDKHRVRLWHTRSGRLVHDRVHEQFFGFLPGSNVALTSGLWQLPSAPNAKPALAWAWRDVPRSVAISADGSHVAARGSGDDLIDVWRLADRHLSSVDAEPGVVLAVSDDGEWLIVAEPRSLRLQRGEDVLSRFAIEAGAAAFAPHGVRVLARAHDGSRLLALPPDAARFELVLPRQPTARARVPLETHAMLFLEYAVEVRDGALIRSKGMLGLPRWDYRSGAVEPLLSIDDVGMLALSADGRWWAATKGRRTLVIGRSDRSAPAVEVAADAWLETPSITSGGETALLDADRRVVVRGTGGMPRWTSPPNEGAAHAKLTANGREALVLRRTGERRGIGLDAEDRWQLQTWRVGATQFERSSDLGFEDQEPLALCFVSADGRFVRRAGRWHALAASSAEPADLHDDSGCREAEPHGLRLVHALEQQYFDVFRGATHLSRIETLARIYHVNASAGGEVVMTEDAAGRLRVYPLAPALLVAQACERNPRRLRADEARRWLGDGARTDVWGRRFLRDSNHRTHAVQEKRMLHFDPLLLMRYRLSTMGRR